MLGLLFTLYVVVQYYSPQPRNWSHSYRTYDKEPFGGFILGERLGDLFSGRVSTSYHTLYERKDSLEQTIIITERFSASDADLDILFEKLDAGQSVFIASQQYYGDFADTFNIEMAIDLNSVLPAQSDSIQVSFNGSSSYYNASLLPAYFNLEDVSEWELLAASEYPILLRKEVGQGVLILCAAPLLFTNYGLVQDHLFAEFALTRLENGPVHYTQFYHSGKPQSTSPFRFVLTEGALTAALYLTLATILALLIINSRRKQRPVPVINPPENTTVHFIKTMGALFFRERRHVKAAQKLAEYFFLDLQKRYFVKPAFTEKYYQFITSKTGLDQAEVIRTFEQIEALPRTANMASEELRNFQDRLRKFNYHR